jgi:dephospho-CoA kinase
MSNEERKEKADLVISNDGGFDELREKIEKLWEGLKKER